MYKIAVCDDDEIIIQNLHKLCQNYEDVHNTKLILSEYTNPNKLISDLEDGKQFDIFFIDIEMPQMNGLDVIRIIKSLYPEGLVVVFTSYAHYAIEAIELEIFRYMVKNKLQDNFDAYLTAAINRISIWKDESYYINSPRKKTRIFCRDIIYCYKDKKTKNTVFVTRTGEIRERRSLKYVWNDLKRISDAFVIAERGCLVNMFYVVGISKNQLLLENNIEVTIGVTCMENLKNELKRFWRKRIWPD